MRIADMDMKRKYTRTAAGVLVRSRETSQFLLLKRGEGTSEPHTWGCAGGGSEKGETPKETALRELREETCFNGEVSNVKHLYIHREPEFAYFNFVGEVRREFHPVLDWEHSDWVWAPLHDFPSPLHPAFGDFVDAHYGDLKSFSR